MGKKHSKLINRIRLRLKAKIWLGFSVIVLLFSFFILFYFPIQQEKYLLKNYNKEVQSIASSSARAFSAALDEQKMSGIEEASKVKKDKRLRFFLVLKFNEDKEGNILDKELLPIFSHPPDSNFNLKLLENDSTVVKKDTILLTNPSGINLFGFRRAEIIVGFSTAEISESKREMRNTSMVVSLIVLAVGIGIGFWLAQTISVPLYRLREAAKKVGMGDRTQKIQHTHKDEIGELGIAFNQMVDDLAITEQQLRNEKKRSDDLLLNILPEETALELKTKGYAEAKQYDDVTVMFTDFKNFTIISEQLSAKDLVAEIDMLFRQFDAVIEKYNIEKIKTIGDAYLCVSGLPQENPNHAFDILNAAKEIITIVNKEKELRIKAAKPYFDIRIGVNSGGVVAGVVGSKKFAYDIWGDTVNTAARMEQNSEPGKINVSETTYQKTKDKFSFTYRGNLQAKNKGEIPMYFLE